jgi:hypothetical protein
VGHVGSAHHFIGPTLAGVSIMVYIFHARGMFSICNSLCASAFGLPLRLEPTANESRHRASMGPMIGKK